MAKKEKIVYIDDGSTVADMSGIGSAPSRKPIRSYSSAREKFDTFFTTMKMMILPTLFMIGFFSVLFLLVYLIL